MGCGGSQPAKGEEKKDEQQAQKQEEQKPADSNAQNDKAAVVPAASSPTSDTTGNPTPKVLVLFYSTYGHLYQMAKAVAEGAREAGATVDIKRVPETLPKEVLEKMHAAEAQKAFADVPVAEPSELANYDAIIFGSPTRFGNMAAQMKTFLDATGGLWMSGALVGKVGGVFVGSATQHGGQEATIRNFHTTLFHHGIIVVGLPYAFQGQMGIDEINGCSPYGASTIAGGQGERQPSKVELDGAHFQGKHTATITAKLLVK